MPAWARAAVVAIIATLIAVALLVLVSDPSSEAPSEDAKFDAHIIQLDREAIDQAYRDQIMHLFQVWMKDEHDQPRRAIVGARQARRAYIGAMTEIDKRAEVNR